MKSLSLCLCAEFTRQAEFSRTDNLYVTGLPSIGQTIGGLCELLLLLLTCFALIVYVVIRGVVILHSVVFVSLSLVGSTRLAEQLGISS